MKKIILAALVFMGSLQLQAQTGNTEALNSIGALSAFTIYDVYCFVGSLADGYSSKVYDGAYIKQLVDEQLKMLSNAQSTMQSLGSSGYITDEADKDFLSDINSCFELLIREGNALNAFVDSGSQADADAFQAARNAAWEKIAALLGIKNE